MAISTVWWILAGTAVALELLTGTFYLLMLALGLAAGALAAHAGFSSTLQFAVAAVIGGGAVAGWRLYRQHQPPAASAGANPDVNMDVGQSIVVTAWDADGSASVRYRGAQWSVSHRAGVVPEPGAHRIVEVVGSRLIVEKLSS